MIPVRLRLRNFLSYGEEGGDLDFSGWQVACLAGENGHGKSALLDAITWALWGRARARSDDELMRLGSSEMLVEFEFLLDNEHYRVIRGRSLRSGGGVRRGQTTLELQIYSPEHHAFRPLSGNSIAETEAKIQNLLRIDYETFINSAFILQGRADEFTLKRPAERIEILAELLNLGVYADLEARAREKVRECEKTLAGIAVRLQDLEKEVARRAEYEQELQNWRERLEAARGETQAARQAWQVALEDLQRVQVIVQECERRRREAERLQRDLAAAEEAVAQEERRIAEYRQRLERRPAIEADLRQLADLRAREQALERARPPYEERQQALADLEKSLQAERSRLEGQRQQIQTQIAALQRECASEEKWREEAERLRTEIARLESLPTLLQALRHELEETQQRLGAHRTLLNQQERELANLRERLRLLRQPAEQPVCPVCRSPLDPAGRERLIQEFTDQGLALKAETEKTRQTIESLDVQLAQLKERVKSAEEQCERRERLSRRLAQLEAQIQQAAAKRQQIADLAAEAQAIAERLAAGDYAEALRAQLAAVRASLAALGYDPQEHAQIRQKISQLLPSEQEAATLPLVEREYQAAVERWERAREQVRTLLTQREEIARALARLEPEASRLPACQRALAEAERRLDACIEAEQRAQETVTRYVQLLEWVRAKEKELREQQAERQRLEAEKGIYAELAEAFGKKGVQLALIENVIPEIEEEANLLLARMTDHRFTVKLETQRETVDRRVVDTLEIRIADEMGTRKYELFSGGEAFRVNFALRVALSKLLARRAGARLQTLVIDEGFGALDSTGRQRIVEAITAIRDDFARILVITHIDELRDAFPVRIEVVKTEEGSRLRTIHLM